ncbi:MAG: hypothetical protein NUW24_00360 [Anaerolineae bacterium]|nr:hypothetical protein [Anaerolineae bacterium]MDH7472561.1 hypothetical protein [Anaerolineae bacterium]
MTRIDLLPLARLGCALGAVLGVCPGLACSITALVAAAGLRRWLETWEAIEFGFLDWHMTLDFVQLLGLKPLLRALQTPGLASAEFALALIVSASVASGLVIAGGILLVGLVYNLLARWTGGVIVELEPLPEDKASAD